MDIITEEVREAVSGEDEYQRSRWDPVTYGRAYNDRSLEEWILYMEHYLSVARGQVADGRRTGALHTMRKVVTMGVQCMRYHGALTRPRPFPPMYHPRVGGEG